MPNYRPCVHVWYRLRITGTRVLPKLGAGGFSITVYVYYARHDRSFDLLSATSDKCSIGSHYLENSKIEITYHSKVHQIVPHVTGLRGEVWVSDGRYGVERGGTGSKGELQG